MKTKRRLLSVLLALCMVFTLVPMTAFAADTPKVSIYTQQAGMGQAGKNGVVSGQYYLVEADGSLKSDTANENNYNIYYDESSAKLTINNLQISSNKSLYVPGGTTINVLGDNKIEIAEGQSSGGGIGVVSNGDITITGTGNLYISSSSREGICRATMDNSFNGATTQGGVIINGDINLTIDHYGAATCIRAVNGDITIGGNAKVALDPRAGIDKDNYSIIYFNGGNITIQDNAQVESTGALDTTGKNTDGDYGKVIIKGNSSLTITNTHDKGVSLRGAGGVEILDEAKLTVSSNTQSGQAVVAGSGAIKIEGEATVNMTNSESSGNTALYAKDIEVTGKLTVSGGINGLSLNSGNTVTFNSAEVKVSDCMIGVSSKAQITNSLIEVSTTSKAFNTTTNASLTNAYAVYAGTSSDSAAFVSHENGAVKAGTWGQAYVRIESHVCTYNQQIVSAQYKAMDATCTQPATYYYSCICGAAGTDTFENGSAAGHRWSSWTGNGDNTHGRTCSVCQTTESQDCSGGTATCTAPAVCEICGQSYGEKNMSNHIGTVVWVQTETMHKQVYNCCQTEVSTEENHIWEDGKCTVCAYPCAHTGGEATCSQLAVCEDCGSQYGELNPDNHKAVSEWTQENGKHYHKCAYGCDTHLDEADCSGGTAACTASAVCEICEQSYGSVNPDNHTGEIVWTQTATTHSSAYNCCNMPIVTEEAHEWENGVCTECGYTCQHTGGGATCSQLAVCEICGSQYREVDASNHTNLVKTEAKPATHLAVGNTEYWYCDGCDKYFSDEAGTNEITLDDIVIPELIEHAADGTGWYSDETNHWNTCECGTTLNAAAHTFAWVTDKEATVAEAGSKHEECTECGYVKTVVEIPALKAPEYPPVVRDTDGGTITVNPKNPKAGETVTITAEPKDGKKIDRVVVLDKDGKEISVTDNGDGTYTFIQPEGEVTIQVTFKTQTANAPSADTNSPKTGDNRNIALWIALLCVSGAVLCGIAVYNRKRRRKQ